MAKVTYRGVVYDTNRQTKTETKTLVETYRGVQHEEKVNVEVAK